MRRTVQILKTLAKAGPSLLVGKRAGSLILGSVLVLLLCLGLFLYARESEPQDRQPEILVSTLKFRPAGWQILAINPETGDFRNVSNFLTADN